MYHPAVTSQDFGPLLDHPAVRALVAASGETACHLVGGVLRDHVLGLPLHDIDAVVAERGLEIAETLAAELPARLVLLGGKDFAAYRLVGEDVTVDLWDRAGTSLHEDLARRDFTVNSIALSASTASTARAGEVADPFGGLGDLERRVLRATTSESFSGDPLRVLRLPRLLLRLPGFTADPETVALARLSSPQLNDVAAERVRDELNFLFDHPEAHRGFALLVDLEVYPGLWTGHPGQPGRAGSGSAWAEIEMLPRRIGDLRRLDPAIADTVDAKAVRLASAFTHLPPSRAGREPADVLAFFRDAGYMTRADATEVAFLLRFSSLPHDETGRRRFLHQAGRRWATLACWIGVHVQDPQSWRADLAPLVVLARREGEHLFDPPRLLTGEEVQALLGVPPGPEVGKALAAVRQAQVDGKVRTREEAEKLLRPT